VGDHGDVPRLGGGDVELPRAGDAGVEPGLNGAGHRARDALLTGDSVGLLADMAADQRFAGGCDGDDDTGEVLVVVADSDPAAHRRSRAGAARGSATAATAATSRARPSASPASPDAVKPGGPWFRSGGTVTAGEPRARSRPCSSLNGMSTPFRAAPPTPSVT